MTTEPEPQGPPIEQEPGEPAPSGPPPARAWLPPYGWQPAATWPPAQSAWPPPPSGWPLAGPPMPREPGFVPGPVFIGITALALMVATVGSTGPDVQFLGAAGIGAALTVGAIWLICFTIAANDSRLQYDRRTWARWTSPPAIFFLAVAFIMSGTPATMRFDLSKAALGRIATSAVAGTSYGPGWIGLYHVDSVRVVGKAVQFVVSQENDCSFIYSPGDTGALPSGQNNFMQLTDYGDGWWYGCQGYPSD